MLGAIIMIVVLVILIPVGFLMSMPPLAALFGYLLKDNTDGDNTDSELLETNY